jgi:hypothetical protein
LKAAACDYNRPALALACIYLEAPEQPYDHASVSYASAIEDLSALLGEQLATMLECPPRSEARSIYAENVRGVAELLALAAKGLKAAAGAEQQRADLRAT